MIDYRLYLVTDDPSRYAGDWLENVLAAVEGGVTCVQYRDTESADAERYARVRRLQEALKARRIPLIVNNDARLAAAVKAEGVHVGQHDLPVAEVRKLVGAGCEIGLSLTSMDDLKRLAVSAPEAMPDALGIGPVVAARKTKADAAAALGPSGLSKILASISSFENSPIRKFDDCSRSVAIGGITLDNAAETLATGVGGLAVVSAFSKAADPSATAKAFFRLLK